MASGEKITVWFEPKGDKQLVKAINALAKSQGRLSQAGHNVARTNQRVSKTTKDSNAGMLALGGTMSVVRSKLLVYGFATTLVTKTVGVFTSAAMKQEDAEKKLAVQLGFTSKRLLEYATAQQKVTAFGDEEVLSVMGQISAFAKSEEQIEALTKATLDLSEGMGIGLNEAGLLIGKTFGSTTNSLSRYGIAVSGTAGSQARLESLTASVADKYGDLSKNIDTTSKAIKQMKNAVGDAAEEIGDALLPSLKSSAISMTDFVHNSVIPFISNLKKIDIKQTAENFIKNGDTIVQFFVGLAAILPKAIVVLAANALIAIWESISKPLIEFVNNLSGNFLALVRDNFFLIGLEGAKALMNGFNWIVDKMPKVADLLGLEKFDTSEIEGWIGDTQKSIADNSLFTFFKDTFEKDIFDIETIVQAFGENYRDTIGQLIAYQQEVIDDADGGGSDGGGGFFAKLFNMSDEEKATFQEQWQMFHNAVMGVANAYDTLKMQQISQAKEQELATVKDIRNERIRQVKVSAIEAKYAEQTKKHKEKMRDVKVAEAISNTALGITAAWDEPFPLNAALVALIAASGALQIQTIKGQKFKYGGMVGGKRHSQGGTLIEAERGEFVMSRDAVEAVGIENLNRMNTGLGGGGGATIVINNPVLGKDMIEDEIVPQIKEALRRGGSIA